MHQFGIAGYELTRIKINTGTNHSIVICYLENLFFTVYSSLVSKIKKNDLYLERHSQAIVIQSDVSLLFFWS